MKTIFKYLLFFPIMTGLLTLSSCGDDDETVPEDPSVTLNTAAADANRNETVTFSGTVLAPGGLASLESDVAGVTITGATIGATDEQSFTATYTVPATADINSQISITIVASDNLNQTGFSSAFRITVVPQGAPTIAIVGDAAIDLKRRQVATITLDITAAEGIDELTVTDAGSNVVATVDGADIADPANFSWEYTIPDGATVGEDIVLSHNVTDNAGQTTTTAAVYTVTVLEFDPVTIAFADFENEQDTVFSEASSQTITLSVTKDELVSFDELAIAIEVNDDSPVVTTVDVSGATGDEIDYTLNVSQVFLDEVGLTFFISDEFGNNSENITFDYDVLTTTGATFLIEDITVNGNAVRQVRGNITEDVTFAASDTYYLSGGVEVSDGATLTVAPGSIVYAQSDNGTQLTIDDSGVLSADGTAADPIVFTSGGALEGNTQEPGDWSGIRVEGAESHNSGMLNYLRIEFGGDDDAALRLNLVDVSTTIDFVQVFRSSDIGLEARAGNVNLSHIFISEAGGVSIDLDDDEGVGYAGNMQYVIVQTSTINEKGGRDFEGRDDANFTVSNMTMIGSGSDALPAEGLDAMRIRDDVGGFRFFNTIIAEYSGDGVRVDDHMAINGIDGDFVMAHSYIFRIGDQLTRDDQEPSQALVFETDNSFLNTLDAMNTPMAAAGIGVADFVPDAEITSAFDPSTLDSFFSASSFVGAIGSTDWTTGWSVNADGSVR